MIHQKSRHELFEMGVAIIEEFISKNPQFKIPPIKFRNMNDGCGMYDDARCEITIDLERCARFGFGGRSWSWPTHKIDRTPFGVIMHEFGHYVDHATGGFSKNLRRWGFSGVPSFWAMKRQFPHETVSGYEPDCREMFAETFRVFCANPGLLELGAPHRYKFLIARGLHPRTTLSVAEIFKQHELPKRQLNAAASWVKKSFTSVGEGPITRLQAN